MSRVRNPTWENDENLKADIQKYVLQNLTRKEVLDFLGRDYPQYAWSLPTLSRRMAYRYFEIKYVDYETDLKVVEMVACEQALLFGLRRSLARSRETRFTRPNRRACSQTMEMAVKEEISGPGQLLGYQQLAVPRGLVYDVMTKVDPEGLESRAKVGQKKRHRGPTGTFTSLVR